MHNRLSPASNRFVYNIFLFYVDLDELQLLSENHFLLGYNKFNVFSFFDKDHLQLPIDNPDRSKNTKQHISDYLKQHGVDIGKGKIMLLTHYSAFGYVFNPVSFYYCFDEQGKPLACVAEVSNTFREMKPYFLGMNDFNDDSFSKREKKLFYVSPFIDMDAEFDFALKIPDQKLNIRIDDWRDGNRFFISTLTGESIAITNGRLLWYAIRYPFITLKVIGLIHWQAVKLWAIKRVRYFRKNEFQELQRDVYEKYKN